MVSSSGICRFLDADAEPVHRGFLRRASCRWCARVSCANISRLLMCVCGRHEAMPGSGAGRGIMTIAVKAYANADDVLIAWQPDQWPAEWVGFQIERRDDTTQLV